MRWYERHTGQGVPSAPWLHPEAVTRLETLLGPEMRVLEHGSGGSTLWLAERVRQVTAVECDPEWYAKVQALAPANVRLILAPGGSIPLVGRAKYDLLLVDGMPLADRALYLDAAAKLLAPGGWLVLDNANRPEYFGAWARLAERAELLARVDGNAYHAGTRYLVTEFWRLYGGASGDADRE